MNRWLVDSITSSQSPGPQLMCVYSWTSSTAPSAVSLTACMSHTSYFKHMYTILFHHCEGDSYNHAKFLSSTPNSLKIPPRSCCHKRQQRWLIGCFMSSLWLKIWLLNELDITIHVIASQLCGHCDVISSRLWRHQQNKNRASETRGGCVKLFVFIVIYGFVMSCKK